MLGVERVEKVGSSDVKAVLVNDDVVVTGGRDGKVRIHDHGLGSHVDIEPGKGYINSLAMQGGFLFVGCQDGSIVVYSMNDCRPGSEASGPPGPVGVLQGHSSNVCCLDTAGDCLVSSSWDYTAVVWRLGLEDPKESQEMLRIPHPAAVWSSRFAGEEMVVTGCADRLIRIFKRGMLVNTLHYHVSCIRSMTVLHEAIVSVDNEGIVLKTSLDGKVLGHYAAKDFMYTVSSHRKDGREKVICGGENGRVVVLGEDLEPLQGISIPATSCWGVVAWGDRIYAGGSDGRLYVYSSRACSEAAATLEEIRSSQAAPLRDGEFVSGGQKFKALDGNVYQEVDGEWVFLGEGQGIKPYDNTFQVELENKYYTLSFNNSENVYEVAENFLRKNKLRDEFRDDIVDFIKKNFAPVGQFRIHSGINVQGVRAVLAKSGGSYPCVLGNLEAPKATDNEKVKEEMRSMVERGPVFVALDLIRYFMTHGYSFNLSFLLGFAPRDKKEAVTFVRLVSNLLADPPFNLEVLHRHVLDLRDQGLVDEEVLDDYFTNRALRNKA